VNGGDSRTLDFDAGLSIGPLSWRVEGEGVDGVHVEAAWEDAPDGPGLRPAVVNRSGRSARLAHVSLQSERGGLSLAGDWRDWRVYKMGWNVSAASGVVPLGSRESAMHWRFPPVSWLPGSVRRMVFNEGTRFRRRPGAFESEWVSMLIAPDGRAVSFGATGFDHAFARVEIDAAAGSWRLVFHLDGCTLPPGASRPLDPVAFRAAGTAFAAMRAWALAAARNGFARCRPVSLWCSWYSGFYDRVDRDGLLANLQALRAFSPRLDCVQLDDGYQAGLGDWLETNGKFPGGLAPIAAAIRDAGFRPGLWTAPFAVARDSSVAAGHPDWVVRDGRGRPVAAGFVMGATGPRFYHALDTTHPGALDWIRELFSRLHSMGWRLFKLDFLTAAAVPGMRHDPQVTRCEAYRRGMRAIRDALPDDAMLIAGISPLFANAGLVDQQRLGPDTAYGRPAWRTTIQRLNRDRLTPGVANNVAASLVRCFTDGVLWSADCDAVMDQGLPQALRELLETVDLLAGSTLGVGHDFRTGTLSLPLAEALASCERACVDVPDLGDGPFPRQLVLQATRDGCPVRFHAILNPDDRPAAIRPCIAGPADSIEFRTGKPCRLHPDAPVEVPGRSCRLFVVEG
jgi:alpha-galactosidase